MTETMLDAERWLTVREAAALRDVTVSTIHRWIAVGVVPPESVRQFGSRLTLVARDAVLAARPGQRGRARGTRLAVVGGKVRAIRPTDAPAAPTGGA